MDGLRLGTEASETEGREATSSVLSPSPSVTFSAVHLLKPQVVGRHGIQF
jgi:hypothetical protein